MRITEAAEGAAAACGGGSTGASAPMGSEAILTDGEERCAAAVDRPSEEMPQREGGADREEGTMVNEGRGLWHLITMVHR